jgi:hypothetical protein
VWEEAFGRERLCYRFSCWRCLLATGGVVVRPAPDLNLKAQVGTLSHYASAGEAARVAHKHEDNIARFPGTPAPAGGFTGPLLIWLGVIWFSLMLRFLGLRLSLPQVILA